MYGDNLCNNFIEIIAGTNNFVTKAYMEAKSISEDPEKAKKYVKKFITSIESISNKGNANDKKISASKGNMKQFDGYGDIKYIIDFIRKNIPGNKYAKDLITLHDCIDKYQSQYTEAYNKNVRLVILEYESCVFLLVTGLAHCMCNNIDVAHTGTKIKIQKKNSPEGGAIIKLVKDMVKELNRKQHKDYLESMIKLYMETPIDTEIKESTIYEGVVDETFTAIDKIFSVTSSAASYTINIARGIKSSVFGILPMIRSILYLRYKKKADTINALEQQVQYIKNNIEQLENRTNINPKEKERIIKRQEAYIKQYQKRADKLRAQLIETEREVEQAVKKNDEEIKSAGNEDDDFILESFRRYLFEIDDISFFESGDMKKHHSNKKINYLKGKRVSTSEMRQKRDYIAKKNSLSFFWNKKKKKKGNIESGEDAENHYLSGLAADIFREFVKLTSKKTISLKLGANHSNDESHLTDTKIGGIPYWPEDMKYPEYNGDPMVMLAQLNFSKLPRLDGFPSSGLLQFFINLDDYSNNVCKTVYHSNINKNTIDNIPKSSINLNDEDSKYFPFTGVFYPSASIEEHIMSIVDKDFDDTIEKLCNDLSDIDLSEDSKHKLNKLIVDNICSSDKGNSGGSRIGGHPYFTQWDIRDSEPKYDTLLLQIDSENGIMWGDMGISNFFINSNDLKNNNFNDVYFTWDCF